MKKADWQLYDWQLKEEDWKLEEKIDSETGSFNFQNA